MTGFTHEIPSKGETNEWYTPPELFATMKIEFDLDPCAPPESSLRTVPAKRYITQAEDGMRSRWEQDENVFLNPPYGKQTGLWQGRCAGVRSHRHRMVSRYGVACYVGVLYQEAHPLCKTGWFARWRIWGSIVLDYIWR